MFSPGRNAPAIFWRAFFLISLPAAVPLRGAAPPASPPELAQVGLPNAAEAARLLEQFRRAGVAGEFFFEFDFRTLPRRGEERIFKGRLWGGRRAQASIFRVELTDQAGGSHRFLIRSGADAAVWRWEAGGAKVLDLAASLAPLVPGVEITAFDLQMPFLYWPEANLEKLTRMWGRPAYAFLFRAPPNLPATPAGVTAARAYLDTQFNALMQTELLGAAGRVVKTFSLISLKKVGDQHIPKQADYRNELTRDKTRLQVTGAALDLRLPATTFEPEGLAAPLEPPPAARVARVDP
jgi:hypothetical protein